MRTPTVLQMEAAECGAASLAMILGYYGRYVSLEQLRVDCGISRDGSKASYILKAAREHGLVAKGYKKEIAQLPELKLPAIVFWDFNHFVVLDAIKKDLYVLNDPAQGRRHISKADFEKSFTGVALEFEPGAHFKRGGAKPSIWHALKTQLLSVPAAISFIAAWALLLALVQISRPATLRFLVDDLIINHYRHYAAVLVMFVASTAVTIAALTVLRGYWITRFGTKLLLSSKDLVRRILRLPIAFFSSRYVGDVTGRVQGHTTISQMMSMQVPQLAASAMMALLFIIALYRFDWVLASTCVAVILSHVGITQISAKQRAQMNEKATMERNRTMSAMISGLYTIEALKASGAESEFFARIAGLRTKASNAYTKSIWATAITDALPNFWMNITIMVFLCVGALRVIAGDMTVGMLVACEVLALLLLSPMSTLSRVREQVAQLNFHQARLDDVHHQPDSSLRGGVADAAIPKGIDGVASLAMTDVTFSYDRFATPTIEHFDLTVKPGKRVALVGTTGSGKSTIAKLICGLYEPASGEIQINRDNIGYVEQDIYLLAGSVRDNLTLCDPSIPMDDIIAAAKDAQIHDQIVSVLGGYEGLIEEGGRNLSGGEVQRLEIARALVRNPSLLVLDECMSALDPITEQAIDQNIKRRGCTCIVVAHRLSTIRDCDEIIVLEGGRIAQRGTHDELMAQGGKYQQLIAHEE